MPAFFGGIWKLEFQGNGNPHYHLLLGFDHEVMLDSFSEWVQKAWYEIVGSGDVHHFYHGTYTQLIYLDNSENTHIGRRKFSTYIQKTLGKPYKSSDGRHIGRVWGEFGKLPKLPTEVIDINDYDKWKLLMSWVVGYGENSPYLSSRTPRSYGVLVYGDGEIMGEQLKAILGK